ncbi:MAG: thioredoxin [Eubacterium sp.]|jgi:thioredoxin 1|nr:thioredoxin [Eubacterium sp.]
MVILYLKVIKENLNQYFNKSTNIKKVRRLNMAVMKVNKESFETEVLKAEGMVLVDFFADWCGPCKMLSPIVDEVAEENTDIKVCKINVDEEPELAMRYNVMSIPTLVVIQNGEEVNKSVGLVSKEDIIKMVK